MKLLNNMMGTIGRQLECLRNPYLNLVISYGLTTVPPTQPAIVVDHEKTKLDQQHELAGYRKRTQVFVADIYADDQEQRNNLMEGIKNLFEDTSMPILDAARQETSYVMTCDGVTGKVDLERPLTARMKIYVSTLID